MEFPAKDRRSSTTGYNSRRRLEIVVFQTPCQTKATNRSACSIARVYVDVDTPPLCLRALQPRRLVALLSAQFLKDCDCFVACKSTEILSQLDVSQLSPWTEAKCRIIASGIDAALSPPFPSERWVATFCVRVQFVHLLIELTMPCQLFEREGSSPCRPIERRQYSDSSRTREGSMARGKGRGIFGRATREDANGASAVRRASTEPAIAF